MANNSHILSPIILQYNGKLCDVTGNIRMVIFSEELKFILKNKGVLFKIHSILSYSKGTPLKDFANNLFNERISTNNVILKYIYKLILNSSYGRFSINSTNTKLQILTTKLFSELQENFEVLNSIYLTPDYTLSTVLMNDYNSENKEDDHNNVTINKHYSSHKAIQIASAISSYSRIALLEQSFKILELGSTIYYMDTDSIFFSMLNINNIPNINKNLGG
jgi:hypothetical protein